MASARASLVTGLSLTAIGVAVVLVIAACGPSTSSPSGSGAVIAPSASAGGSAAAPTAGASASATSSGEAPSVEPSGSPVTGPSGSPAPSAGASGATPLPTPSSSAGGGNLSAQLCQKLTVDEVASATDLDGLTARPEAGDATGGSCSYLVGDRAVAATMIVTSGGKLAMDAVAGQSAPVPNLGDAAAWVAQTSSLYIRKGDTVVRIQLLPSIIAPDQIKARTVALGTILAGRF